ncbi:sulfurtransferase [Streptomyces eurocidicus]|uniref:Sulfurtransferase n=1 Tax=Streptomyces eurocidicus TaxID=66423 RepID=A0A2N8NVZ5_STREU|nr:rhodanese-like domain-containing protein [Streptomyces eurocidicus]MBB5119093.1 rhodanese-related sulfurtransferase [Streptomyces eurocidicus]MBF6050455.1 rhodanese-like domain-containing protein [Streptomyces eurocidicus]PNE32944.1 sulfurtransferase [Streptomyces eurocidicus]
MARNITRTEVEEKIKGGKVAVVEALPAEYYEEAHLPGALNLPHDAVDQLAPGLLPDKQADVIVYCSSDTCANSGIAAERLTELGYKNVYKYTEGKQDWIGAGLPTESGA